MDRVKYRQKKMDFVTNILSEFDNLDPAALVTVFQYKLDEENNTQVQVE